MTTASPASNLDRVLQHLAASEKSAIQRLIDWLKIPSISTDPAYREPCAKACQWAGDHLRQSGFRVQIVQGGGEKGEPGHPLVLAHADGDPAYKGPHLLFYGHYDVQPVDPLELWESKPFEPVIKPATPTTSGGPGERIVARGAVDDKGQVMMFLEAMRSWKEVTGLAAGGAKITVLLEGEEESGSISLPKFFKDHADTLKACDVAVVSDTGMLARGKPAITYGLRGIAYTEITLHGPDQDLHSGLWGGRSPNPLTELVKVLAQLWDKDRRITIPGFYDRVKPVEAGEREQWKKLGIDPAAALKKIGLPPEANIGETGYSATEREWARPTAELNGLWGGYTGPGAKTVIGAKASAKVSFRLVPDQKPEEVYDQFFKWLRDRTPPGCKWDLHPHHGGNPVSVATSSAHLAAAKRAVQKATGLEPALIKSGGSIPIAAMFKSLLGLDTIFMGYGLEDDRVHSPNEKFELDCYRMGAKSHAALIAEMWGVKG